MRHWKPANRSCHSGDHRHFSAYLYSISFAYVETCFAVIPGRIGKPASDLNAIRHLARPAGLALHLLTSMESASRQAGFHP
ncbi:hypothetical protein THICB2_400025 [Thiomonas sp. CB2]|nr:hypothetical protein THICB2_400025 [Thiomonas sp. CB2]